MHTWLILNCWDWLCRPVPVNVLGPMFFSNAAIHWANVSQYIGIHWRKHIFSPARQNANPAPIVHIHAGMLWKDPKSHVVGFHDQADYAYSPQCAQPEAMPRPKQLLLETPLHSGTLVVGTYPATVLLFQDRSHTASASVEEPWRSRPE